MSLRRWGFFAALLAAFVAGTRAGVEYAKGHYVVRDRKFIEGKTIEND